ncbi:hypothetical protein PISL3812_06985 [Talaromyces islandicus]|uniref:MARVEL domain-containing protein n=1 Tax=Talaromyces islandicus TaxID=28573 RepID=A0A0U1M4I6_TALIS|nr:hypothetical protein PISL3812_06985 [Talaromyces islandicus]
MSEEASERTPLLTESATVADTSPQAETSGETSNNNNNNNNASADDHYARFRRPFTILTPLSLFLSVLAFVTSAAAALLVAQFAPPGWYLDWDTLDENSYMVITTLFTTLFGFANLARLHRDIRLISLVFNCICDVIFMFYLFVCSVEILAYAASPRFPCRRAYDGGGNGVTCRPIARAVQALLIISSGSELLLTFVILALFLMRCVLLYNSRPWTAIQPRNGRWSVPTGVLTFEFSIKFLRQEERIDTDRREQRD